MDFCRSTINFYTNPMSRGQTARVGRREMALAAGLLNQRDCTGSAGVLGRRYLRCHNRWSRLHIRHNYRL